MVDCVVEQCLTEWRPAWLTERLMSSLFFLQCDQVVVYSRPRRKIRNSELSKVNFNRALRLRRKIRSSERSTVDSNRALRPYGAHWLTERSIQWLTEWLTGGLIQWLIEMLVNG